MALLQKSMAQFVSAVEGATISLTAPGGGSGQSGNYTFVALTFLPVATGNPTDFLAVLINHETVAMEVWQVSP